MSTSEVNAEIRALCEADSLVLLTQLIHRAYAPHAVFGLRYWGTHQSVEDTGNRCASGKSFVARLEGSFVGTITVRAPQPDSPLALYRAPETWSLCQFAVAPELKGMGLGKALHQAAEAWAVEHGAKVLALDTAAPAKSLIAMYEAWGYSAVGEHDWRPHTNYPSVVMSRPAFCE